MTYQSVPTNVPKPRASSRPPLGLITAAMLIVGGVSVLIFVLAAVVVVVDGDPQAGVALIAGVVGIVLSLAGWVITYIARTLDDIGYAVGAPATALPLAPQRDR